MQDLKQICLIWNKVKYEVELDVEVKVPMSWIGNEGVLEYDLEEYNIEVFSFASCTGGRKFKVNEIIELSEDRNVRFDQVWNFLDRCMNKSGVWLIPWVK